MSKEFLECKKAIEELKRIERILKRRLKQIEETKKDMILILVGGNE